MAGGRDYDPLRLQELILYIADRSRLDPRFGKTKLNKILFYADFGAFRSTGRSITGAAYQHLDEGPCPHQLLPALRDLGSDVIEVAEPTYAGTQKRLVPTREAKVDLFTGPEIATTESAIERLGPLTNKQASDLSHETKAWRLTKAHQEIPYGAALLVSEAPNTEDLLWMKEICGNGSVDSKP